MRSLVWITLLLSMLSGTQVLADECDAKAAEIAGRLGLDAGARTRDDFDCAGRPHRRRTMPTAPICLCKGPLGMTLRYLSPPSPGAKWYEFVGRSGMILTGLGSPLHRARGEKLRRERAPARWRLPLAGLGAAHGLHHEQERRAADVSLAAR